MIVVDTNVIAYFFILGDKTPRARALWEMDSQWCVPALWSHEFLNVLAAYARNGSAPLQDVQRLLSSAIEFITREYEVDRLKTLEIAVDNNISANDAQFVCLAEALDVSLVTEDKGLVLLFPGLAKSLSTMISG